MSTPINRVATPLSVAVNVQIIEEKEVNAKSQIPLR